MLKFVPMVLTLNNSSTTNKCPSKIIDYPLTPSSLSLMTSSFYSLRSDLYNLLYNYYQQIDGGNTPSLIVEIQNSWPQDAWDLRNDLITISPFVSADALREAAFSGILPDALLLEVCLANPDASRSDRFIEVLQFEIPNSLPQYMIDMIRNSWSGVTTRTLLERNIATKSNEMNQYFNFVLKDIKSRTEYSKTDLINWYNERSNIIDFYSIADIYIESGSCDSATNVVNEIVIEYSLDELQQEEFDNYLNYIAFRQSLISAGKTTMDIDSLDIVELSVIAHNHGIAAQNAKNILCVNVGICEPCYGIIDTTQSKAAFSPNFSNQMPIYSKINANPNPANQYLSISWEIFNDGINPYLRIVNSKGQIIEYYEMREKSGIINIPTLTYSDGIYYFQILSDEQIIESGKFVILH